MKSEKKFKVKKKYQHLSSSYFRSNSTFHRARNFPYLFGSSHNFLFLNLVILISCVVLAHTSKSVSPISKMLEERFLAFGMFTIGLIQFQLRSVICFPLIIYILISSFSFTHKVPCACEDSDLKQLVNQEWNKYITVRNAIYKVFYLQSF